MKISTSAGLKHSLKVYNAIKRSKQFSKIKIDEKYGNEIYVDTFYNGRETGFTFTIYPCMRGSRNITKMVWCVYEHRNSDQIILNGREYRADDHSDMPYDLPYKTDSKWDYIASFDYNQGNKCSARLIKEVKAYVKKLNKAKRDDIKAAIKNALKD